MNQRHTTSHELFASVLDARLLRILFVYFSITLVHSANLYSAVEAAKKSDGDEAAGDSVIVDSDKLDTLNRLESELNSRRSHQRKAAASALGKGDLDIAWLAIPTLMEVVADSNADVAKAANGALETLRSKVPPTKVLIDLIRRDPLYVADSVAAVLPLKKEKGLESLLRELDGASGTQIEYRRRLVNAIGKFGSDGGRAVPSILQFVATNEGDPGLRQDAIYVLGKIGGENEEALNTLSGLVNNVEEARHIRVDAANAIGTIVPPAQIVVEHLVTVVDNQNDLNEIRVACIVALSQADAKRRSTRSLFRILENKSEDRFVRESVAQNLVYFADLKDVPKLTLLITESDVTGRWGAALNLGFVSTKVEADQLTQIVDTLISGLNDESPKVRQSATWSLGRIGPPATRAFGKIEGQIPEDLDQLDYETEDLVSSAVRALVSIDPVRSRDAIVRALKSGNGYVAQSAVIAIEYSDGFRVNDKTITSLSNLILFDQGSLRDPISKILVDTGIDAIAPLQLQIASDSTPNELKRQVGLVVAKIVDNIKLSEDRLMDVVNNLKYIRNLPGDNPAETQSIVSAIRTLEARHDVLMLQEHGNDAVKHLLEKINPSASAPVNWNVAIAIARIVQPEKIEREDQKHIATAISKLEPVLNTQAGTEDETKLLEKAFGALVNRSAAIKAEIARDKAIENQSRYLLADVPWPVLALGGYAGLFLGLWFVMSLVRPLWLLNVGRYLAPVHIPKTRVSLRHLFLVAFFDFSQTVLDAWVAKNLTRVRSEFEEKPTVKDRRIYVSTPITLATVTSESSETDKPRLIHEVSPDVLRSTFSKNHARLLIRADGGAGKTSLACEIAKWAMAKDGLNLLTSHAMIPVLVEQELDRSFRETVFNEVQRLIGSDEPLPQELFEALINQRRILVIVDRFSEMSDATRKRVFSEDDSFSVAALIVTSRTNEKLDGPERTEIEPAFIMGNQLSSFMEGYLTARDKRTLFEDAEFFDACRRLSLMVGERSITALLGKMYADQLITAKERQQDAVIAGPENIPNLMITYLRERHGKAENCNIEFKSLLTACKQVAWTCVKETYRPGTPQCSDVVKAFPKEHDAEELLSTLQDGDGLGLIQRVGEKQDRLRFVLDPLAEYLAGMHVVEELAANKKCWKSFLEDSDEKGKPERIRGFLLATRDCCLGAEIEVPADVPDDLARRAGMDPEKFRRKQLEQRIRRNVANLDLPEAEDRITAAQSLGNIGALAKNTVPALLRALRDKDWRVRATCAQALGSIGGEPNQILPEVDSLLDDEHELVRRAAIGTLSTFGKHASDLATRLKKVLKSDDIADVREDAARAIRHIGAKPGQVVSQLIEALNDPDWDVRQQASISLGTFGSAAVKRLTKAFNNEDELVRCSVADALAAIGPDAKGAVKKLIHTLEDEDWGVRQKSAVALGAIGVDDEEVIEVLRNALNDPAMEVKKSARKALEIIKPEALEFEESGRSAESKSERKS